MEVAKYMTYLKNYGKCRTRRVCHNFNGFILKFYENCYALRKKSCIRETPNLSSNTNYISVLQKEKKIGGWGLTNERLGTDYDLRANERHKTKDSSINFELA